MTERFLVEPTNGQLATSPCGGSNCLVWSAARAVQYHTRGEISAITGDIRRWISGTTCGGTTLAQVTAAVKALYGVELVIRYQLPWEDWTTLIRSGCGGVMYGGYSAVHGSGEDSFPLFNGGHGWFVQDVRGDVAGQREYLTLDPGADGRRAGIPNMVGTPGRWWPEQLLKRTAGAMPTNGGTVGFGFVSAAFTRDTEDDEMGVIDAKKIAPPALVDITATTLYLDEACTTLAYPGADKWPGALGVGSYGWPQSPDTKAFPIRIDLKTNGEGWMVAYAPKGACSNFRSDPTWCPALVSGDTAAAEKLAAEAVANAAAVEAAKYGG